MLRLRTARVVRHLPKICTTFLPETFKSSNWFKYSHRCKSSAVLMSCGSMLLLLNELTLNENSRNVNIYVKHPVLDLVMFLF